MPASATAAFALIVVLFVSQSRRLARLQLASPIIFTTIGVIAGATTLKHDVHAGVILLFAEITLALMLFHDAAQVNPRQLRAGTSYFLRLLLIGLPLTVVAGFGAGYVLFPHVGGWLVLVLAAALAPTDAGLGAAIMGNPAVPARVRRILNVESGLNDGLVTPIVLFAIAAAGSSDSGHGASELHALRDLAVGLVTGVVVGYACGLLLSWARRRGLVQTDLIPIATLAIPLLSYFGCVAVHGNGFVAAFVSGVAYVGAAAKGSESSPAPAPEREPEDQFALTGQAADLLSYAVWALFGLVVGAEFTHLFSWAGLGFALLSLTVIRMVPVAVALCGTGMRWPTVTFIGWFGPRGLASVVFALIAFESDPGSGLRSVLGTIAITVVLSVLLHGLTAGPFADRYGRWARADPALTDEGHASSDD